MADTNEIISRSITINNNIQIKALSENVIDKLSDLVVWDKMTPDNKPMIFGGEYFKPTVRERAVIIKTGSVLFDYELKAIMIAALHLGTVEGGTPYKWEVSG